MRDIWRCRRRASSNFQSLRDARGRDVAEAAKTYRR